MSVELITGWDELSALEPSWNALNGGMPMRSWDWLATWWKHYGTAMRRTRDDVAQPATRHLHVVAVYRDSPPVDGHRAGEGPRELIGIAPWYLDRTLVKGNVLRWLGSGEVCTDHMSLVCRPSDRDDVAAEIANSLTTECNDWDRLDLNAVDADDAAIAALVSELEERGCLASRHAADSCWLLGLPENWDAYLASLSKSHRKQLRRLERDTFEAGRACWHQVGAAEQLEQGWRLLVDLHQRRRRSLDEPGCFASRAFHDFHREVAERLFARGQLRLSWLELDGWPVAAEYHFTDGETTYAYQGGLDPDRLGEEPGRLSTILCLRAAITEGNRCFDFLRGDEPYKAHWRATAKPTFDYRIVPDRRLARLRGRLLSWSDSMTDWIRHAVVAEPTT